MDDTSTATIILIIAVLLLISGIGICVYSFFFAKKPLIVLSEKKYKNWIEQNNNDVNRRDTVSLGRQEVQQDMHRRNIELAVQSEATKRQRIMHNQKIFSTGINNKAYSTSSSSSFSQTKLRSDFLSQAAHSTNHTTNKNAAKIGRANTFSHFPVEPSAPTVQDLTEKPYAPVRSKNFQRNNNKIPHSLSMKKQIQSQHRKRLDTNPEESERSTSSSEDSHNNNNKITSNKRVRRITVE